MRKESELGVMHVCIWCKPSEWDRLKYLSAPSGKALSKWICDTVYEYKGEVEKRPKVRGEKGQVYPLCVTTEKWNEIKERAEECGVNVSQYVLAICLKD